MEMEIMKGIVRPLYKAHEPFMDVSDGVGFLGVVQYRETDDTVQCHICAKWFKALGAHIKGHGMSADEYREKYGLNFNLALCGTEIAAMRRANVTEKFIWHTKARPMVRRGRVSKPRHIGTATFAQKNKYGLCDLQMKARYEIVRKIVRRLPTTGDLKMYDAALLSAVERRFPKKPLSSFRADIGETPMSIADHRRIPDIEIVAALRKMAKMKGRAPRAKDFPKAACKTILRRFGGWVTALRIAGLGEQEKILPR